MKRIVVWLTSTVTIVVLLFGYRTSTNLTAALPVIRIESPYRSAASAPSTPSPSSSINAQHHSPASASVALANLPPASPPPSAAITTSSLPSQSVSNPSVPEPSVPNPNVAASESPTTHTGSVEPTRSGPVQVQITLTEDQITAIDVLQYPQQNVMNQQINAYALPTLLEATIDAQSANIDMVSGATVTSDGYVRSLQSALDQGRR